MGVEIDRNFHGGLEFRDNGGGTQRAYQACHILKSDYLGAETFHFAGFFHEVFVGEYFLGLFRLFAEELGEETGFLRRFGLGVYGVADGAVGDAAKLVDEADGLADVVDVVESVEYTHHVEAVGDSLFIETFENAVGVGHITEEVAAAGKSAQQGFSFHCLGDGAQTIPWRFVEIAHHRVGHSAAPDFHDVEAGVFVVRQQFVDFCLAQTSGEQRLLTVAKGKVADFELA